VYRRVDLWRTFVLVVALLLTAVSTGVFAREFCASDPQFGRHPIDTFHSGQPGTKTEAFQHIRTDASDLKRSKFALIGTMSPLLAGRLRGVERI
jgi:hypothetical protein